MSNFAKFDCPTCGQKHDRGLVDSYLFGDRLLEGVMFIAQYDLDKKEWVVLDVVAEHRPYFEGLNQQKWLAAVQRYCEGNDIWTCPECGADTSPIIP